MINLNSQLTHYAATWWVKIKIKVTRFRGMVEQRVGVSAPHPAGLTRFWELERRNLSMEAVVLKAPSTRLFTEGELRVARKRLTHLNFSPE